MPDGRLLRGREPGGVVVTISREYGAGGLGVADRVAGHLHYELLNEQIPAEVARRLGIPQQEVDALGELRAPLAERFLTGMRDGTADDVGPIGPVWTRSFDESVRREIEGFMRERAESGDVVILGRLGNAVLAGMTRLVRAFVYAQRDWRIARVMETLRVEKARAVAEVDRLDAERRRFALERYNVVWGDRRYYDVIVDSSRLGLDGAADAIVAAVRAREAAEA